MYAKLKNNEIEYAPVIYFTNNKTITNFNKSIALMKKYGFKEVRHVKPDEKFGYTLKIDSYSEDKDFIYINYKLVPNDDNLEEMKNKKIEYSKLLLAQWCENNPISFIRNNGTVGLFSVTEEKQTLLSKEIQMWSMYKDLGIPYQVSWNEAGKPCSYDWTIDELVKLAVSIGTYIKPQISKQQYYEYDIKKCETIDELNKIEINY